MQSGRATAGYLHDSYAAGRAAVGEFTAGGVQATAQRSLQFAKNQILPRFNPRNYRIQRNGWDVSLDFRSSAKYIGEPFAFGYGVRSERVNKLVDEAGKAANIDNIYDLVDSVSYISKGSSNFYVDDLGMRYLEISSEAFRNTRAGQLIDASHELVHAQQYNKLLNSFGGKVKVAREEFFENRYFGSWQYAKGEVVAERLARHRVRSYLGGLSPQQETSSARYIASWRQVYEQNRPCIVKFLSERYNSIWEETNESRTKSCQTKNVGVGAGSSLGQHHRSVQTARRFQNAVL